MTEEKEIWEDIKGYEGLYQVSNLGKVKSLNYRRTCKERILIPCKPANGYLCVSLYKNGIHKTFTIHRLIAQAFIENHENLQQVNHIDEDKTNNCVSNLEWCDRKYNNNYGTRNERMLKTRKLRNCKKAEISVLQFIKDGKFVNEFPSRNEAERCTGITQQSICACCKGKLNSAGGHIWFYAD